MKTTRTFLFGTLTIVAMAFSASAFNTLPAGNTDETFDSSPCTECLERARNNYATCVDNAGSDEAKTACLETLNAALANCRLISGCL